MQKVSIKQKLGLILFGVFLCLFIFEAGMRLWSNVLLCAQEQKNKVSTLKISEYRILCLGESTTVWGGDNSWPAQLEQILNQKNIGIKFKVINKGRYSIQSPYIISIVDDAIDKYNPDMVISMMGINDGDNTVPYKQENNCHLRSFLSHLKIYKLASSLWLHIIHKCDEFRDYKLKNKKINQEKYNLKSEKNDIAYVQTGNENINQREYSKAEKSFKKALEIDPRNDEALVTLGRCYMKQGRYVEAIEMINKAREINPKNIWVYNELGNCYSGLSRYSDAEKAYKEALELDPKSSQVYANLGFCYKNQGDYKKAEEMFKKAIEVKLDSWIKDWSYIQLGICYRDQSMYEESDKILKKAIEVNPKNWEAYAELIGNQRELGKDVEEEILKKILEMGCDNVWAYQQVGWYFDERKRYQEAEEAFKKAIEIDPVGSISYIALGEIYGKQKKTKEEKALFEKVEKLSQGDDRLYGRLAVYYLDRKDYVPTEKYFKKANEIRMQFYPSTTRNNYRKLKEVVIKKGLKFVCVQYPMRKLEPLKKLFDSTEGIIFVDNEKTFKAAIKQGHFADYFEDCFAGDFGHGTPKGNKLLANNIMNAILKKVFGK